uniref:Dolichyl-diphosphooligosaccharide--protein glycosyltransferase subunit 1 n=1 Tax=Homalodisca liturata TaxID=320908 RepID=A0A1B6JF47_9HEMI
MSYFIRSTVLLVMCFLFNITSAENTNTLLNKNIATYIDISSQVVKIRNLITVENKLNEPISSYVFIVDPQWKHNLSFVEAFDQSNNTLKVNRIQTDNTWLRFEIVFHEPLSSGETETINIFYVVINYLQSYPKSVEQNEKHLVLFHFNVYLYSIYLTKVQVVYVHLGTSEIISVTGAEHESTNKPYVIKYGPYSDVSPLSEEISVIHYENNSPFLTVEKLERFVRISHWGFLKVWEKISLKHTGPKFKGPYERVPIKGKTSVVKDTRIESFITSLPGDAFDIDIKDEIGSIHSVTIDDNFANKIEVDIRPRFVLYGGWKTYYEITYSLPIANYVTYDPSSSTFVLSVSVVDRVFPNMVINEAEMSFILPEGGRFQDINPYYKLENNTDNRYCYFFDVICREVVSFKRHDLTEHHVQKVSVSYSYPQLLMLTKPLALTLLLFVVFLLFVILPCSYFDSIDNQNKQSDVIATQQPAKEVKKQKKQQKSKVKKN